MNIASKLQHRLWLSLVAGLSLILIVCILSRTRNDQYPPFDYLKAVRQPQDPGGPVADNEEDIENGIAQREKEYGPGVKQRELKPYSSANTLPCDGPECPYRQATLAGSRGYKGSYFPVEPIKNPETGEPLEDDEKLVNKMIDDMSKKPCIQLCMQLGVKLQELATCSKDCRGLKRERVQDLIAKLNHIRRSNR